MLLLLGSVQTLLLGLYHTLQWGHGCEAVETGLRHLEGQSVV